MTSFNAPPKSSRRLLMLTAGLFMFAAADGALAKNGAHSDDHGSMRSGDSGRDHGDKHSERHEDKNSALREVRRDKGDNKRSENHKDRDKNGDKHAEKHKDKEQDKTAGTTTTANGKTDSGKDLFDKGVVGKTPADIKRIPLDPGKGDKPTETSGGTILLDPGTGGKMPGDRGDKHAEKHKDDKDGDKHAEKTKDKDKDKASGTTTATNTGTGGAIPIDPGKGDNPAQTSTNGGTLPPNDPVGSTHPTVNGGGSVTVSNGVTTYEIQNGPGGVAVYSGKEGTITVTNGKETKTLNGGSLTLSGNVVGVGAAQNIQVGARNGEGRTVVAIRPPAPAEAKPSAPGHVVTGDGSITVTGDDVIKRAGQVGVAIDTALVAPIVTPSIAAYGFVKGGAKGAYDAVGSAAKTVGKLFTLGF